MFMWTSRRSWLVCAWLFLAVSMLGHPAAHAVTPDAAKRATAADTKGLQGRIGEVIKRRDDFPEEPMFSLKLEKLLYWSAAQGGRLLVPVTIRFKGLANSYCRVLTQMSGQAEAVLVDLPEQVNHDACRGFDTVRYLDINGDGALDIAASFSVKSNTASAYVAEQAVFLSGADNPSGYCYSDSASRNLKAADMQSDSKIANALEHERKRLAVVKFECATPAKGVTREKSNRALHERHTS